MTWSNVKLIFKRETRDQLRDRRTLFTIAIMPLVLYPLMGMAMLQVAQFTREHPTRIWIVGTENLPESPVLLTDGALDPQWFDGERAELLQVESPAETDKKFHDLFRQFHENESWSGDPDLANQMIDNEMKARGVDLAIVFTKPTLDEGSSDDSGLKIGPTVHILHNSANDRSNIAADRVTQIIGRWRSDAIHRSLQAHGVPSSLVAGIPIKRADISAKSKRQAATWSKILPFIVIMWSLTGAFYPAIDLCAGEKERGTFETLLSSPAGRSDIAIGKLLTVMSFSMVTSLLNLLSMAFTGLFVASRMGGAAGLGGLGIPPASSLLWLLLALIPISALFSAIALAAAAFARSSKEGQYYLIPLMMISMPLMMVPMLPGARLDLGTSLIPVSGLMLLLRGLIEGQYAEVLPYAAPVCMVTFTCCYLAIRWVVRQFNSESVLFRASEKFAIGAWLQQVMRDRHDLPSVGNAFLLGVMVLVLGFFVQLAVGSSMPVNWLDLVKTILIVLIATIGMPAILMAMFLTRNPRKSLRLNLCSVPSACAAVLMALCFHPLIMWFSGFVLYVYPLQGDATGKSEFVSGLVDQAPGLWAIILLMAVAPAIIEELAYRGFILSGLEGLRNRWKAILITSILFGVAHFAIQQAIITFVIGMILGVIAIETRSLIPCMIYHATHNSITVLLPRVDAATVDGSPVLPWILYTNDGTIWQYSILPGIAMTLLGVLLLIWFIKSSGRSDLRPRSGDVTILQPVLRENQ
ncbi:ABC transporter permease subunit/CPBP intramembrane protease [Mariniblastus fucicola]|uniref:ABC-2 family transporter protein n=1 Tax=Mariniblastus fucicola TaxID=980251 RepID=A0A5B9PFL7_9BACT|nr:ABC transporter permease subunit/CPBP intramembrane protease [Mariniblastus fucicola]QEG23426.1 ABC-2 family transporter protein [Mariniblastus fucicola]